MAHTMDTDYGLPIPMHRAWAHADPAQDNLLPFRHQLDQVTELTAENSTPYRISEPEPHSKLESLPLDVRRSQALAT